jgi:hypothetical protein
MVRILLLDDVHKRRLWRRYPHEAQLYERCDDRMKSLTLDPNNLSSAWATADCNLSFLSAE